MQIFSDYEIGAKLNYHYLNSRPFPHIVLDNFILGFHYLRYFFGPQLLLSTGKYRNVVVRVYIYIFIIIMSVCVFSPLNVSTALHATILGRHPWDQCVQSFESSLHRNLSSVVSVRTSVGKCRACI